jgi:hypothetical protein
MKHYAMKAYGEVNVLLNAFLNSTQDGGEWLASRHCRFTPVIRTIGTHCMDPRDGLDAGKKRKSLSTPALEHRLYIHPARSQPLYRLSHPDFCFFICM